MKRTEAGDLEYTDKDSSMNSRSDLGQQCVNQEHGDGQVEKPKQQEINTRTEAAQLEREEVR